jgi:FkbM family methyltransferase
LLGKTAMQYVEQIKCIIQGGFLHLRREGIRSFISVLSRFILERVIYHTRIQKSLLVKVDGFPIAVNSANYTYWKGVERGGLEPYVRKILTTELTSGGTFIDIGSWIGLFTLLAAKIVGEQGSVHAIEPDPVARKILLKNIALNHLTNVKVYPIALTDKIGTAQIVARGTFGFGNSMTTLLFEHGRGGIMPCTTTTLETFVRENNITPDLIKMDIEGSEYQVIRGSEDYIRSLHPPLLIEIHNNLLSEEQCRYIAQILDTYDSVLLLETQDLESKLEPFQKISAETILAFKSVVHLFAYNVSGVGRSF